MQQLPEVAFDPVYYFSLDAELESRPFGAVPGGFGIDLTFLEGGDVNSKNNDGIPFHEGNSWRGLQGKVLGGHDWIVVTENGVAQFDSRFLIRIPPGLSGGDVDDDDDDDVIVDVLVGGRLQGRVSLEGVINPAGSLPPRDAYRRWKLGFGSQATLPLLLSLTFDVSSATTAALSSERTKVLARYAALESGLYVGAGVARFHEGPYSPIEALSLQVYQLRTKVRP